MSELNSRRLATWAISVAAVALLVGGVAGLVVLGVLTSGPQAEDTSAAESRQAPVATLQVASSPSPTTVPTRAVGPSPTPATTPSPTVESRSTPTIVPTVPVESKSTPLAASSDEVKSIPGPTPTSTATVFPTPAATVAVVLTTDPTATPTTERLGPVEPPKGPGKLTVETESSEPGGTSPVAGAGKGTVYTWEDGDANRRIVLQDDLVVQETAANTADDVVVIAGVRDSIVHRQPRHGQDTLPVFRSESGGELMTLPGGVLLALDPEWDQARVDNFFLENGISKENTSELSFIENGYFIETGPGFTSLELANELAATAGVVISSPNWWREAQPK